MHTPHTALHAEHTTAGPTSESYHPTGQMQVPEDRTAPAAQAVHVLAESTQAPQVTAQGVQATPDPTRAS